jgi:hypothetical protein
VAPEQFVSNAVVKIPTSHALKIRSVRFTSAVTNVRSSLCFADYQLLLDWLAVLAVNARRGGG